MSSKFSKKKSASSSAEPRPVKGIYELDGELLLPQKWAAKLTRVSTALFRQLGIEPRARIARGPLYGQSACTEAYAERAAKQKPAAGVDAGEKLKALKVKEAELELAERSGDLVRLHAVQAALDAICDKAGTILDGIGQSVANEIIGQTDTVTVAAIIDARIDAARELLAGVQIELTEARAEAAARNGHAVGGSA